MNKLFLKLSSSIEGCLYKEIKWGKDSFFVLNKDFIVREVKVNGVCADYICTEIKDNYAVYVILDIQGDIVLNILYSGVLDGTTGIYPYVKEKTTDSFYLLRIETIFYPLFCLPDSEAYFDFCMNESEDNYFEVKVEICDSRIVCTNLRNNENTNVYSGYTPTFAVGNFKEESYNFGTIYIDSSFIIDTQKAINIIRDTNEFMKRYKDASIHDFRMIIIPDGYGSFVLPGAMFIVKDGLGEYTQLVHELIHTNWNPLCTRKNIQNTRFFDEAITQYFMCRVCEFYQWKSRTAFIQEFQDEYREMIQNGYEIVPISQYALYDYGDLSYSFGVLFLLELEKCIGKEKMDDCLKHMLKDYEKIEINFEAFRNLFPVETNQLFEEYVTTDKAAKELLGM